MVNNLNSILIEGNLVRDPVIKATPKGTLLCTFCIATNRYYKKDGGMQKEVSYIDVEALGKIGRKLPE
jgi:single-strand DNA-binding protein